MLIYSNKKGFAMKKLIKIEELLFFLGSIYLFTLLSYEWWLFLVLLFVPDVSMLAYLYSKRMGAIMYNVVHHRAVGIIILLLGHIQSIEWVMLMGLILFSHSSLDRVFDYGLKYSDDFKHTHLQD